jgi:hypothetical protein
MFVTYSEVGYSAGNSPGESNARSELLLCHYWHKRDTRRVGPQVAVDCGHIVCGSKKRWSLQVVYANYVRLFIRTS